MSSFDSLTVLLAGGLLTAGCHARERSVAQEAPAPKPHSRGTRGTDSVTAKPAASATLPDAFASAPGSVSADDHRPAGYSLLFADEFDGPALDRTKWCTRYIYGGGPRPQKPDAECEQNGEGTLDFLNDEQQRYRDVDEAGKTLHAFASGALTLTATKLPGSAHYASAMIRSKRLFKPEAQRSLYITARVKLPSVQGTWPAFWLNSDRDGQGKLQWPPEIDIFEAPLNGKEDRENMLHVGAIAQGRAKEFSYRHPSFDEKWQNYLADGSLRNTWIETAIEWTTTSVCYFVDGLKIMCEKYRWVRPDGSEAPSAHLLLNLAVGGSWAGRHGIDDARFPVGFAIDFVRVYG